MWLLCTNLEIIYEMGLSNRRHWTEFDATQHMQDGEQAENAWKNWLIAESSGMVSSIWKLDAKAAGKEAPEDRSCAQPAAAVSG